MSKQNVKVTFEAPDTWDFDPQKVRMTEAGKIILHRAPRSTWEFVSAEVIGGGDQFKVAPNPAEKQIVIDDACDPPGGEFPYVVTVRQDGREYRSDARRQFGDRPPVIQNEPSFVGDPEAAAPMGLVGNSPPVLQNEPS